MVINMKKKIAVFANAWSEKNLSDALEGVKCVAKEEDFDLFVFVGHAAPGMSADEQREEKRIYDLPEMEDFDGLIVFSSTMNFQELVDKARDKAIAAGIPAISVGSKVNGMVSVELSNMDTMRELVEHLVVKHNVESAEFIAGPQDSGNSNGRVEAWKKVFTKHSLEIKEENIHYTDWSVRGAMAVARDIMSKYGDNLPDAIICANDNLAMATCTELTDAGIKIPEDVIVTGYDNTYDGQIFAPAICTVGQNDYEVGKTAMNLMMKMVRKEAVDDMVIQNKFLANQSCGCDNGKTDVLRLKECTNRFYDKIKAFEFGWSNSWVTNAALKSTKQDLIRENLEEYLARSTMFGNGTTYILEDEKAKLYFAEKRENVSESGYSDELDVITAVERHKCVPGDKISRRQLIPGYNKVEGDTKMYIFMPIHFSDDVFGYAVVEDWLIGISNGKIKIFVDNFNQTVEKIKQNIKLESLNEKLKDLYTKDSLTGLYNRFGFNSEGVQIFNECKDDGQRMVLMFVDINRMKLINDYYGHLQGDMAIKTVADVIRSSLPEGFIAIRFGGDEFLIVGRCENEELIKSVQRQITNKVKNTGKAMQYQFYLSVSVGYLHFKPEVDSDLDTFIKQADESMYEIKAYMHTSDKELKEFVEKCANSRENDIL